MTPLVGFELRHQSQRSESYTGGVEDGVGDCRSDDFVSTRPRIFLQQRDAGSLKTSYCLCVSVFTLCLCVSVFEVLKAIINTEAQRRRVNTETFTGVVMIE
jgi:hypothetical protein